MTNLERKLKALKKCRKELNPSGNRTQEVRACIRKVDAAFSDYIRSDNVNREDLVDDLLSLTVEEHPDFRTSVDYIDRAIRSTENAIAAEERARREAAERKKMQEA